MSVEKHDRRRGPSLCRGIDTETPQIALQASVEAQIKTASKPYTAAALFHFNLTGPLKWHRAYQAAYESDAFAVGFEDDYQLVTRQAPSRRSLDVVPCCDDSSGPNDDHEDADHRSQQNPLLHPIPKD